MPLAHDDDDASGPDPFDNLYRPPDVEDADDGGHALAEPEQAFTEVSAARRLVATFGQHFRWHQHRGRFLVYDADQGRWREDDSGRVARYAKKIGGDAWADVGMVDPAGRRLAVRHAAALESARGVKAVMELARTEPGVSVSAAEMDADPWALNVANGVLDLRTGHLRPHAPELLHTRMAPVAFDPAAECPLFMSFLDRVMGGDPELVGYLQRIVGLSLTADVRVQELFVFWGSGANGKSVLVDTVAGLMGDYATIAPPALLATRTGEEHPTEIADLQGRRLVVGSETEEGARLRVQLVKRLTGDARLKGRYMRQDYFEFPRTFKLVLATNNRPRITENTNAVWRRVRLLPFAVVIPPAEQDPRLMDRLRAEWPGILAWAVRGCLDWQADGMRTPAAVTAATADYAAEQDLLAEYLAARCVRGGDHVKVSRSDLFGDYQNWAAQTGERHPLDKNAFLDRVRRLDGVTEHRWRPVGITDPVRGFRGIGLTAVDSDGGGGGGGGADDAF